LFEEIQFFLELFVFDLFGFFLVSEGLLLLPLLDGRLCLVDYFLGVLEFGFYLGNLLLVALGFVSLLLLVSLELSLNGFVDLLGLEELSLQLLDVLLILGFLLLKLADDGLDVVLKDLPLLELALLALLLFLDLLLQGDQVLRQFFFVLKNQSFLLLRLLLQHAV